jgi:predicted Fe-S protein YdhL (DUF1289 family)
VDLLDPEEGAGLEGGARPRREEGETLKTPCIKVCVMDLQSGLCRGCYRTLEEIGRWGSMDDAQREAVMKQLPARKTQAGSDVAEVPVPPLS